MMLVFVLMWYNGTTGEEFRVVFASEELATKFIRRRRINPRFIISKGWEQPRVYDAFKEWETPAEWSNARTRAPKE